ncbi:hypothetical protein RD792_017585 [Penstemon davidsonii]|uniref:Cytochrome P450 n=1 Tax=Penstemon davidsonii TaxID=160366 RepID=A0ABR0CP95_9LAMI|nr:hypothetical protein RD792_017585 [Penstemon davidsonii]
MAFIFLVALISLFVFFINHFLFGIKNLPPGPNLWHMLCYISTLLKKPHVALQNLAKTYGPLMSLRIGGQLLIVATSPDVVKEIHKTHNRVFSGRYFPSFNYYVPDINHASLVMAKECNDTWRFLRGISQSCIFSTSAIESASTIRKSKVTEMVNFVRNEKQGKVVNIEDTVYATFANIITNVMISRNLFSVEGKGANDVEVMKFLQEVIEKSSKLGLADMFPSLKVVDLWSRGKAMRIYDNTNLIWADMIKERRATKDKTNSCQDFFDVLDENLFSDVQIAILLTELLIGGTDSTTITSIWLMTELIKNQEILSRVRNEIRNQAIKENEIDESLLSECQYFHACIKESLRLHIPGPFGVPHRATDTCNVNGYVIPKDSVVLVNAWAIQVDHNNWEDASSFKPERFLDSKIDFRGADFEYIPFGTGQRMCPGANMAIKNVRFVVASLLHYFEWSLPDGVDPSKLDTCDEIGTTLKKAQPLCLIPTWIG